MPSASGRVHPNVSSVAGLTSVTSPSWSTITAQSSDARRIASLRPSLASSARSERLRAVTSISSAITPTTAPCASRIGPAEMLTSIIEPSRCRRRTSRSRIVSPPRDPRHVAEEELELVVGDRRVDAADRLVGGPAEDLAWRRCSTREHGRRGRSRRSRPAMRRSARGGARTRSGSPRTGTPARARSSPGSRRRGGSAGARRPGAGGRAGRRPRCSRCAVRGGRAAARRASRCATRSGPRPSRCER